MNTQELHCDTLKTCWSCEGTGFRYKSSSGRAYREPCPTYAGTGEVSVIAGQSYFRSATRWLLNGFVTAN